MGAAQWLPRVRRGGSRGAHSLPREHAEGCGKSYDKVLPRLTEALRGSSLRLWRLEQLDWRVDCTVASPPTPPHPTPPRKLSRVQASSSLDAAMAPSVELRARVQSPGGGRRRRRWPPSGRTTSGRCWRG